MESSSNRNPEVKRGLMMRSVIRDVFHAFPSFDGKKFIYTGQLPDNHFVIDVYGDDGKVLQENHIAHRDEIFYTSDELIRFVEEKIVAKRGWRDCREVVQ